MVLSYKEHSEEFKVSKKELTAPVCLCGTMQYGLTHIAPTWMFVPGCNMTHNVNMILVLTWLFNFDILWVD